MGPANDLDWPGKWLLIWDKIWCIMKHGLYSYDFIFNTNNKIVVYVCSSHNNCTNLNLWAVLEVLLCHKTNNSPNRAIYWLQLEIYVNSQHSNLNVKWRSSIIPIICISIKNMIYIERLGVVYGGAHWWTFWPPLA